MKRIRKSRYRWWSYGEFIYTVQRRFIEYGYRLTRIEDIAEESEIAKGTVYCYARSKEALFWLALRWAGATFSARPHRARPISAPSRKSLQRHVQGLLEEIMAAPRMNADPPPRPLEEARAEFRAALAEIYARLFENRTAIRLIQRCAPEHPSLRDLNLRPLKKPAVAQLARFLTTHQQYLERNAQPEILARVSYAAVAFLAVYRKWHAAEIMIRRTRAIRDSLLNALVEGMLQPAKPPDPEELEDDDHLEFETPEPMEEELQGTPESLLKWLCRPYPDEWDALLSETDRDEDPEPEGD